MIEHDKDSGRFSLETEHGTAHLQYTLRQPGVMEARRTWTSWPSHPRPASGRLLLTSSGGKDQLQ